ncbi:TPA: phage tail protein [Acinetobacter baumannii]|nr:phage tail protein [Acinetobacter baumannii]
MQEKTVYQFNSSGLYVCKTTADKSPREENVFLLPANSTETAPPDSWPDDVWPRWNGFQWDLIPKPEVPESMTAAEKLAEFLQNNPDVQSLINKDTNL